MGNTKLIRFGLFHSLGVVVYVAIVALVMTKAETLFGEMDTIWGPIAFLLLFTVSAAICGLLIFGRPAYLFLTGAKREGVLMAIYTVCWLLVEAVLVLAGVAIFNA